MIEFRINFGGVIIVAAFLTIGLMTISSRPLTGLLLGVLTIVSLLLHECGHIVATRFAGVRVKEAGICLKGSYVRREQSPDPLMEIGISLSGPMVNTLIAAALWTSPGVWHWLAIFNLVLSISNLVPLPGSDGRHALRAWSRVCATARVSPTRPTPNR